MGGHVNMMDDVLIANLSPELLRSSLRVLVGLGSTTQQPFVRHIRQHFTNRPLTLPDSNLLFPRENELTGECEQFLAETRCMFSCKLVEPALTRLRAFMDAIVEGKAKWYGNSPLSAAIEGCDGDMIQALQALKETKPEPSHRLKGLLTDMENSHRACSEHCSTNNLAYPFMRSERQVEDMIHLLYPDSSPLTNRRTEYERLLAVSFPRSLTHVEHIDLGGLPVPRLFNGFWQLSSPAWGSGTAQRQEEALLRLVEAGYTAADMADHYGDAELVYGEFRNKMPHAVRGKIYAATKWCVFGPPAHPITREWVLDNVKERCRRLGGRVELLQLHWYDYKCKDYLDVLVHLVSITRSYPDLVVSIGLCNFDTKHLREACEHLIKEMGSVGIVSNQVQFSVLDSRPLQEMCSTCDEFGLKLLTYGSFCGGLLSQEWLNSDDGTDKAPDPYSTSRRLTPSQRKYLDMVNQWGDWGLFVALLKVLSSIADNHRVTLTNVATRWVLQQQAVGAVLVGTRLGVSERGDDNLKVFGFELSNEDMSNINEICLGPGGSRSAALFKRLGDCGQEYRGMH